jgi:hypothetical protein
MDFPMDCFESVFCSKLLLFLNLTNAVLSKPTFGSIFVSKNGVLCAKEIHRLGTLDLKIYYLSKKNHDCVTRQLTKSTDFRQNYLCEIRLCTLRPRMFCPHLLSPVQTTHQGVPGTGVEETGRDLSLGASFTGSGLRKTKS